MFAIICIVLKMSFEDSDDTWHVIHEYLCHEGMVLFALWVWKRERGRQTDFVVSSTLVFIYFCRHLYELCFFPVLTEQLILFFLKCATSTNILLTQLFLHTFCIPEQVLKSGFISLSRWKNIAYVLTFFVILWRTWLQLEHLSSYCPYLSEINFFQVS